MPSLRDGFIVIRELPQVDAEQKPVPGTGGAMYRLRREYPVPAGYERIETVERDVPIRDPVSREQVDTEVEQLSVHLRDGSLRPQFEGLREYKLPAA